MCVCVCVCVYSEEGKGERNEGERREKNIVDQHIMNKQEKKQRKLNSIEIMKKKEGDEFVKVLQEQPIVSAFEYVETMVD